MTRPTHPQSIPKPAWATCTSASPTSTAPSPSTTASSASRSRSASASSAAFLSAGGYHHHIGINTWESLGGQPPAPGTTGLYHLAVLYPTRAALADALRRLIAAHISLDGAADHGVSEALYLHDPDLNGVELYWDRPKSEWPRDPSGNLTMYTHSLNLQALLDEST